MELCYTPLMFTRAYQNLGNYLEPNKVLIIYGPRRVGKTVLLKSFLSQTTLRYRLDNGDDLAIQELFSSQSIDKLTKYAQGYDLIAIDEAQHIDNIGMGLKILVDTIPDIRVIATGSASFELSNKVGEPLTGRARTLLLYPIAQLELLNHFTKFELEQKKEEFLVYGSYPEILSLPSEEKKREYLRDIVNAYLLRDILALEQVKASKILLDLLRLLAFQIGNEVSMSELAANLGIDTKTVSRYLDLLEKGFVLINIRGFSRNLRKEISKKSKYYFYDNGIRNAVISNFNPLHLRDDVGRLWENFIVTERIKKQAYHKIFSNNYFWRTWDQKEVDFVEEREGKLFGYEVKYAPDKKKVPADFLEAYPGATIQTITSQNYLEFIT